MVWVVAWLCLAHLGGDWEGLSEEMVGWIEREGAGERRRESEGGKGEDSKERVGREKEGGRQA